MSIDARPCDALVNWNSPPPGCVTCSGTTAVEYLPSMNAMNSSSTAAGDTPHNAGLGFRNCASADERDGYRDGTAVVSIVSFGLPACALEELCVRV